MRSSGSSIFAKALISHGDLGLADKAFRRSKETVDGMRKAMEGRRPAPSDKSKT